MWQAGGKPRRSLHSSYADKLPPYFVTAPGDTSSTSPSSTDAGSPDGLVGPCTHATPPTDSPPEQPQPWPMHSGMGRKAPAAQPPVQPAPANETKPEPDLMQHTASLLQAPPLPSQSCPTSTAAPAAMPQPAESEQQASRQADEHSMQQALQALGPDSCHLAQPLLQAREALRRVDIVQQDLGQVRTRTKTKAGAAASKIPRAPAKLSLKPPLPPAAKLLTQAAAPPRQGARQPEHSSHDVPATHQPAQERHPRGASGPGQLKQQVAGPVHALQLLQLTETLEAAAEQAPTASKPPCIAAASPALGAAHEPSNVKQPGRQVPAEPLHHRCHQGIKAAVHCILPHLPGCTHLLECISMC